MISLEWDDRKRVINLAKHGIDFTRAVEAFNDRRNYEYRSDRDGEQRCVLIGQSKGDIIAVVFTLRPNAIRIISIRRARQEEVEKWQKNIL